MKITRISKKEVEIRDYLNDALKEESKSRKEYIKAKYAFEWMTENKYLVPEELKDELNGSKMKVKEMEEKINQILRDLDEFQVNSFQKNNLDTNYANRYEQINLEFVTSYNSK